MDSPLSMDPVPDKPTFVATEEEILKLWDKIDAFQTSLKKNADKPTYTFYDGPPFATGLPHYGHILAGTIKDTITRYAHQTGHSVSRRFGWDCHGLPIEFEIDKEYNIKTKDEVEAFGIPKYNEACRSIVMKYSEQWRQVVTRLGRWIDFDNDYKTMDRDFMESVWWVFKQLYDKPRELVYRGFKVMPYSTACATPLSNFEANMEYQNVQDPSVTVAFPLVTDPNVNLLAWTTTPWTLPSNLALCVNPEATYVTVKDLASGKFYILMKERISQVYPNPEDAAKYETVKEQQGKELVGLQYQPLFPFFVARYEKAFKVVSDNYVTASSGTGIVHQAPAFGEDDFRVCRAHEIVSKEDVPCPLDANGRFTDEVPDFKGQFLKDADKEICKAIKNAGRMIVHSTITHSYPFCWRSGTPLIYRAIPSWFIKVESIKDKLLKNNEMTYWVPDFVKTKRFHNWLQDARDWSVSRNRYWGTPLPLWVSDDGQEVVCVGSVAELEELTGQKDIKDLHRHFIDHLTIPSKQGKGVLKRVPEVFDCWFESGSMPYAQIHYPFENKDVFENGFPADFIAEGIDQTRGWFYTLLVLSTALFDKPPFKNLIVNGLVLAADGKKMSKKLKNYPPPDEVINECGSDSLRLYLIDSPVVRAEKLKFKREDVASVIGNVFLRWFNAYRLLVQNTHVAASKGHHFIVDPDFGDKVTNIFDKWILAYTQSLITFVRKEMAAYRLYTVVARLVTFISDLANWYCRLNRRRLKGAEGQQEQQVSLDTLYYVLYTLSVAMAPFTPFFTEYVYQNLRKLQPADKREDSVHYLPYPVPNEKLFNEEIERRVSRTQAVITLSRQARDRANTPLKQPLSTLIVYQKNQQYVSDLLSMEAYIKEEANVRNIVIKAEDFGDAIKLKPIMNRERLGKRLRGDRAKVETVVNAMTRDELLKFEAEGTMTVLGYELTKEDVTLANEFTGATATQKAAWSDEVLIVLNVEIDASLRQEGIMREVQNRVQRLRKASKCQTTDTGITVFYSFKGKSAKNQEAVQASIDTFTADIETKTNTKLVAKKGAIEGVLGTNSSALNGIEFCLELTKN